MNAANLKKLIEIHGKAQNDLHEINIYVNFVLKHRKTKECVHRYEQLANKPVKFILFIKKTPVPKTTNLPDTIVYNLNGVIETEDVLDSLVEIKIIKAEKRQVRKEKMLKLMQKGTLKKYVAVSHLLQGLHIFLVKPDKIWVSDGRSLILTNSKGNKLHRLFDVSEYCGAHTVNSAGELIYADKDLNINKLSADNTTKSTLIKRTELWEPWCICHSASTGDLLVMMRYDTKNPSYHYQM
ncbi:uncharacterized protein LOC134258874 [Saccostrea cucullata]|uniref:uncharacterized protein LOC134258874 n=1 Tax=Saccostrea cuccullata TaxID=36930 RepID=UPI002ED3A14C